MSSRRGAAPTNALQFARSVGPRYAQSMRTGSACLVALLACSCSLDSDSNQQHDTSTTNGADCGEFAESELPTEPGFEAYVRAVPAPSGYGPLNGAHVAASVRRSTFTGIDQLEIRTFENDGLLVETASHETDWERLWSGPDWLPLGADGSAGLWFTIEEVRRPNGGPDPDLILDVELEVLGLKWNGDGFTVSDRVELPSEPQKLELAGVSVLFDAALAENLLFAYWESASTSGMDERYYTVNRLDSAGNFQELDRGMLPDLRARDFGVEVQNEHSGESFLAYPVYIDNESGFLLLSVENGRLEQRILLSPQLSSSDVSTVLVDDKSLFALIDGSGALSLVEVQLGDGSFTGVTSWPCESGCFSSGLRDFDGDNLPDVWTDSGPHLGVYGTASGTFEPAIVSGASILEARDIDTDSDVELTAYDSERGLLVVSRAECTPES